MSYTIPTLLELKEAHLARLETQLGQNSPINDKAFLRVLAAVEAGLDLGHYKYAADAVLQNLALTATGSGLDRIGNDQGVARKQAQAAILEADLVATTGTIIPAGREFVSNTNDLRYKTETEVTAAAGMASILLRCVETGTDGNMEVGELLSIVAQIAGAETDAEVTDTDTLGTDQETDVNYRPRVLFVQRAVTGGGNATDHKIWSEAVSGVRRAFPYSGRPAAEGDSYPGDRTVYVESETTIDVDGLAPGSLLDAVRAAINTDPDTGLSRMIMGLTDATLFVESIYRTSIFVQITNLDVSATDEAACKTAIETALDLYFRSISPFVDGVDVANERTDSITGLSISEIVQDVVFSYGGSADSVAFGLVVGVFISLYFLEQGELTKLGAVAYA